MLSHGSPFRPFLDYLGVVRRARTTIRRYGDILDELHAFAGSDDPRILATHELQRFASAPRGDGVPRAPAGVNLRVAVLRAAFGYLHDTGVLDRNVAARLVGVRCPRRVPKHLTAEEMRQLLAHVAAQPRTVARRDVALVVTLWQTALRVSEIARLTVGQLDRERLVLRGVLVKGGHVFDVAVNRETLASIDRNLAYRGARGSGEPLFARLGGAPLSVQGIQRLFARWRIELGWTRPLHPHVLRHTLATDALAARVDVATIADLLRHQGLRSVMVYAAVKDPARRAALAKLGRLVPRSLLGGPSPHRGDAPGRVAADDLPAAA